MRLKQLRINSQLTQKQLADGLGLTTTAIQNYEHNKRKPTYDVLITIANYFGISIDYLMERTDNPEMAQADGESKPVSPLYVVEHQCSDEAIQIAKMYDKLPPDSQRRIHRYVTGEYDDWKQGSIECLMEKAGKHC